MNALKASTQRDVGHAIFVTDIILRFPVKMTRLPSVLALDY